MMIDQLLAASIQMLGQLGVEQDPQSRVSALPDLRSFRMYRTQKLIDDPNTKVGVAGDYGRKHVLQLAAIKSLQAQRLPLREIRTLLADASDRRLEEVIGNPTRISSDRPATNGAASGPEKSRRWLHFQPAEGVMVMVAEDVVMSTRPSSIRALGEMVTARLLSCRS